MAVRLRACLYHDSALPSAGAGSMSPSTIAPLSSAAQSLTRECAARHPVDWDAGSLCRLGQPRVTRTSTLPASISLRA